MYAESHRFNPDNDPRFDNIFERYFADFFVHGIYLQETSGGTSSLNLNMSASDRSITNYASYFQRAVQLHVCNDTFAISTAQTTGAIEFSWGNPDIFLIPGTTRIVRMSQVIPDPDADLRDLRVNRVMGNLRTSRVPLSPVFLAKEADYEATVEEPVTGISIIAVPSHPNATLRYLVGDGPGAFIDAHPATPDTFEIALDLGTNLIDIEVTGEDPRLRVGASKKKLYRLRVTRSLSDDATLRSLDLSQGTLTPAFAPAQTTYTATVGPTGLPVVTVTAETNHPEATYEYLDSNDAALADADPATPDTFEVDLPVGDTIVKVKVTAQDDTTTQTYTTTITRQASTDASLKTLALDRGTLAPAFSPTETSYAATVGVNDNTRVSVTAEPTYPNATVEFLDAADATLADADPATPDTFEVGLAVGENVVKVKVTAEDSTTTRTYTTTIAAVVAVQVSIAAAYPTAAPGLALPAFTLTASDAAAADFEVTLTFTQDAAYLANTTQTVTIAAGDSSATQKFPISTDLSLASGNLTATITGGGIAYVPAPAPDNAATVAVVVADPLLTAVWDENAYTVQEGDDDSVTVEATLRTAAGVPRPREAYAVAVATLDGSATAGADYTAVDTTLTVAPGDWTADGTQFTADLSPTVDTTDDTSLEDDETFHVLLSGATGHIAPGFDCPAALQDLGGTTGCATLVTIDDDETLSVTGVTVTSTPASGDTYLATEVIQFTAGFTAAVTVDTTGGTPTFPFRLGSAAKTATYASGSDSDALVFTYTVAAGDLDRDGVSWQADAIELNGATVRLMTTDPSVELDADLDYEAAAAQSAHKVDARAPVLESATYLGTELTLAYDEALDDGSVPAIGQYTLTLTGGTAPSVSAVTLTLSAEPSEGTTLAYAVPTANPVQDVVGNDAAAFSGQAVERGEQLRLVNGTGDHEGRLEIRLQGGWGTVCDDYWTKTSEDVACRILGYAQGSADAGLQASDFPPLATGNIWLDDVRCTGGETRLTECPHRRVDNSGDTRLGCTHGEDVAMRCLTSTVPYVTAVEVSAGPYAAGSTLQVTLVWSEPVNVTTPADGKPPKLWVAYGATVQSGGHNHAFEPKAELAPYASGSGTNRTVFEHTPSSRYFNDVLVSSWDRVEVLRNTLRVRDGAITSAADSDVAARLDHPGWPERLASLSVADASVNENAANAHLRFVVTLSPAVGGRITVAYATADGTATAGSDYAAVSGTLTFKAGERDKTVWVRVLSDAVDEGSETLTLTLSDPSPPAHVRLGDAEATGTINNTDPVPRAWLARFGRTLGSQVVETVSERVEGGVSGSHLSLGGVSLGGAPPDAVPLAPQDWLAGQMTDGAEAQRPEERALTGRDLLLGSSFRLVSGADDGGGTVWSAWGRVSTGGFRAAADGAALDGRVVTGLLGFDAEWRRLLAGVLLLRSEAEGGYDPLDGGDAGTIASTLTGLYPYARLRLGGRLSVWAVAGAGTGDLTLIRPHETIGTGLDVRLGALGLRGALPAVGGFDLALKSDVLWVRTASDAVAGQLAATSADVNRLRLILEGGRPWTLSSGAVLAPTVQAGLRHDGGDAETGTGVEVGAGLRYSAGMLSVDAQVRTLLAHQAGGYEEWGASGSIRLSPNASGLGPSLALLPSWGAVDSGVARLWSQPDASALVGGGAGPAAGRVNAELGWGLAVLHGRGVLTPYARLALAEDDGRSWHLGTRLALPESLDLSLEGSSRQAGNGTAHDLTLRATLPW